jgi:hypothetical protein
MKNVAMMVLRASLSALLMLTTLQSLDAAEFFCPSGNVTCLIAAINEANLSARPHTIFLEPGTYTLTNVDNDTDDPNGLPSITGTIAIRQNDQLATIERDPGASPFRLFHVAPSGDLKLYGLGLRNGDNFLSGTDESSRGGGAIYNRGSLSLEQLAIYQNTSFGRDNFGGAIRNDGRAVLVDTELYSNFGEFHEAAGGGAIGNLGELTITRVVIRGNNGNSQGGITSLGEFTMSDSAVIENEGGFFSGGLSLGGTATIVNSTIARNDSEFFGEGVGAGGITVFGSLRIINSTVAENRADRGGAGINNQSGTVELQNTIVALNRSGFAESVAESDCDGPITSLGNNILGTTFGCTIDLRGTDFTGDPGLGDFDHTHYPLLSDSRAIDSANRDACQPTDQLGLPRLGICDIGSVEFQDGRLLVAIDIRPKRDANRINPSSTNNINVAVFSGNGFDATAIDPTSVRFGATGTEAAPIKVRQRDVDGDGTRDFVLRFQIQDLGIKCGDTSASLTGQIADGQSFSGSISITTRCKPQQHKVSVGSR